MTYDGVDRPVLAPRDGVAPVAADAFVTALNSFATGVAIITSVVDGERIGATVSSLAALASDPPTISVCFAKGSATAESLERAGVFAVTVVDEDSATLAGAFASRAPGKFDDVEVTEDTWGMPLLPGIAWLSCRVERILDLGSHREFHARVDAARVGEGAPLAYFRGAFAHLRTGADDAVLRHLRQSILSLRSDGEETVDPDDLAREHGVPRGFVLRALSALATEQLVQRRDGVYHVLPVPDEVVYAAYEAKLVIEIGVATQVIGTVSATDIAGLRERFDRMSELRESGRFEDFDDYLAASHEFREYFVGLAGSPSLLTAYRSLGLQGIDRRTITEETFSRLPRNRTDGSVVDALASGDLPRLVTALRSPERHPRFFREGATD